MEMSSLYSMLFGQDQDAPFKHDSFDEETFKFFLSAIKLSSMGMWSWDVETDEVLLSSEVFRIIAADPENFDRTMKYIVDNIIHPEFRKRFEEAANGDLERGELQVRDCRIISQKREECWIRFHGKIITGKDGQIVKVLGTVIDVTEDYNRYNKASKDLSFMESLLEASPNPIFYKGRSGLYRYCNTAFLDYLGMSRNQVIGKSVYDIARMDLAKVYDAKDDEVFRTLESQVYESQVRRKDGMHDVIFNKAVHLNEKKEPVGIVGVIQDITVKKKSEKHLTMLHKVKDAFLEINHDILEIETETELLKTILAKLQGIFEQSGQACMFHVGNDGKMRIISSYGYDEAEASQFEIAIEDSFWWEKLDNTASKALIIDNIQDSISEGDTKIVTTKSGELICSSLVVAVVIEGRLKWILSIDSSDEGVFTDVHKSVAEYIGEELPLLYRIFELNQKNLYLSRYDSLTGMMTRSYLESVFDDWKAVCTRNNLGFCAVMFDLDGLKTVNDTYGHAEGDKYIRSFAQLLLQSFRESDKFFRIGGDEFLGLFFNSNRQVLHTCIEELRRNYESKPRIINGKEHYYSFSFGMADYPSEAEDRATLVKIADQAMYKDKENNKHR